MKNNPDSVYFNNGSLGLSPETAAWLTQALAEAAVKRTPAYNAFRLGRLLAKLAAQALAKRGPKPTHSPQRGGGSLAPGWISEEFCGGADVVRTDGSSGYTPGTCRTIAWPASPSGPIPGNLQGSVVEGHKPGFQGDPSYAYSWPYYWDLTRRYTRVTGTELFSPPDPRVVPVPDPAWPLPLYQPQPMPLPLSPAPQRPHFPQFAPWAPSHRPLERPLTPVPLPIPHELVPELPKTDPWGEPIRGPGVVPRIDPLPGVISEPNPALEPEPSAGQTPGVGQPQRRPWQWPNTRVIIDPRRGITRNNNPHNALPPLKGEVHVKALVRMAPAIVKFLGQMTEACDAVDAMFDALPPHVKARYDSTEFLRRDRPKLFEAKNGVPSLVEEALKGNWGHYKYSKPRRTNRDFGYARKAFNDRNAKEKNPLFRSKWGRKATCQVKLQAVHENAQFLPDNLAQIFENLIRNEIQDRAIGKLGKAAAENAKQTGRSTGWISRLSGY